MGRFVVGNVTQQWDMYLIIVSHERVKFDGCHTKYKFVMTSANCNILVTSIMYCLQVWWKCPDMSHVTIPCVCLSVRLRVSQSATARVSQSTTARVSQSAIARVSQSAGSQSGGDMSGWHVDTSVVIGRSCRPASIGPPWCVNIWWDETSSPIAGGQQEKDTLQHPQNTQGELMFETARVSGWG